MSDVMYAWMTWWGPSLRWCGLWQIYVDPVIECWDSRAWHCFWVLLWFYIPRPFRAPIVARLLWDCGLRLDWWDCDDGILCVSERLCCCDNVISWLACYAIGSVIVDGGVHWSSGSFGWIWCSPNWRLYILGGVGWVNMIRSWSGCNFYCRLSGIEFWVKARLGFEVVLVAGSSWWVPVFGIDRLSFVFCGSDPHTHGPLRHGLREGELSLWLGGVPPLSGPLS